MTLQVKSVVDGCVDIQEALRGAWRLETMLFALSSSNWLVRILRPIICTLIIDVLSSQAERAKSDMMGSKLASGKPNWREPMFLSNFRINFNAALALRFNCTKKTRTSPSLSTARHNQRSHPRVTTTISSRRE